MRKPPTSNARVKSRTHGHLRRRRRRGGETRGSGAEVSAVVVIPASPATVPEKRKIRDTEAFVPGTRSSLSSRSCCLLQRTASTNDRRLQRTAYCRFAVTRDA